MAFNIKFNLLNKDDLNNISCELIGDNVYGLDKSIINGINIH